MARRDTKRSVGWGSDYSPPHTSAATLAAERPAYSYVRESPGFTQHVREQAQKKVKEVGGQFSDLFAERPGTPAQHAARSYFMGLTKNEQAALTELFKNSTI